MPIICTMELSPDRIFISYSRADGRAFAEEFEHRLEGAGIQSWRDLKSMGSGDIRPQVLRAIETAKHFVLILSRRALVSDWVKREWSHARMMGKKVSPVLADPSIQRSDLPLWIRREEVYKITEDERWTQLVRVLEGPGETPRVPWMPGDLPNEFVPRPAESEALKTAILIVPTSKAVALTVVLRGAGGYGKTTLANHLCRDPDVRFEFADGILRVEIGKERGDVTGLVIDLIEKLDPQGKRPGFQDVVTASEHLGELIGAARLLLVIDDVWREEHLRPFLRGGPNCVRLVTTRLPEALQASHIPITIDEMRDPEALSLMSVNLSGADKPATRIRLAALADRLGNWAQMIGIANGWMQARVSRGEALEDAIVRFEQRLVRRGLTGFDPKNEQQRNRTIRACVEASLEELGEEELGRLGELAVLPEDASVPLRIIEALWSASGGLDADETDDLIRRFDELSLLQNLDLGARTLRLHDNMIWYLRDRVGPDGYRTSHAAMIRAIGVACEGQWATLPPLEVYGWRYIIRHFRGAGQDKVADRLLTDYNWVKAKLHATGPQNLFDSYFPESADDGARLIGWAIALALPALAANPRELPRQLYGRLAGSTHQTAIAIVALARQDSDFRPAPRWPGLTPPGGELLRLVEQCGMLTSASFSPDGTRIVTASWQNQTARLWNAVTGQEITILDRHENGLTSASFSPDGARIVTTSWDRTARLWDAITGKEITVLRGHEDWVQSASFSSDGTRIITSSYDGTARLWETLTGQEIATFRSREDLMLTASFSRDNPRIVTKGADGSARIWDAITGKEITVLRGHEDWVQSASFSLDGARVVTASQDRTARLWDAITGKEIHILRGHEHWVWDARFSLDGSRIVTASSDRTARVWDTATGHGIAVLRGHGDWVRSASFSPDSARIVTASADGITRLWNAITGQEIVAPSGHQNWVWSVSFSSDNTRLLTASRDGTTRLWDAITGQELAVLLGHEHWVESASFSPDGSRIVTASWDRTARLWDASSGQELAVLLGHEHWVREASFSPDNTRVLTASRDGTARLWDAVTGQELAVLLGHEHWVQSASFSSSGACIVTASHDRTSRVWNAITGHEIATLRGHKDFVESASFSPDGTRIVTASWDRTARLWEATTGQEIAILRGHEQRVQSASFSSDGTRVITASWDGMTRIWEAVTGQEIAVLRGHEHGLISCASFSPDGTRVVTASWDRTVRLWDATNGQEIVQIVLDAAITAMNVRGDMIALGDMLGRIHIFDAHEFLCDEGSTC
jgi:WD40 repeat protein